MTQPPQSPYPSQLSAHWQRIGKSTAEILNVRAEVTKRQTWLAAIIERIGRVLAHPAFFSALLAGHGIWVLLNLPVYPWFKPWDPYPFTFLATLASVESPFIALLVLMYQRRESRVNELREETNLQVSLHLEREITMMLRLLRETQQQLSVTTQQDTELLEHLQENLDPQRLMQSLRRDLQREEGGDEPTTA